MHELPDDVLYRVVELGVCAEARVENLRNLGRLCLVNKSLCAALQPLSKHLAERVARDMSVRAIVGNGHLLAMNAQRVGTLECRLLAIALAHGHLSTIGTMWLQNNRIGAQGLRWLARGLRAMPEHSTLRSISLGANGFQCGQWHESGEHWIDEAKRARVGRALDKLQAAAASRGVCVRLNS